MADQRNGGIAWTKILEARFWANVAKGEPDECWEWQAGCFADGMRYGQFRVGTRKVKAHRFAYTITLCDPFNMRVLHNCDNPLCCNPNHLFLGTDADNAADRAKKGRSRKTGTSLPCARNPSAKLTVDDVVEIRKMAADGIFQRQIARQFGMSQSQIGNIVRGDSWRV